MNMIRNVGKGPETEAISNQPTPQRQDTHIGSNEKSDDLQAKVSVDVADMHASAQFGTNDLNNAWNSAVDAIEHPGDVIDHAEQDISNAAEVEANQILYGKGPENPLPPNPITDAIQDATYNPTMMHLSEEICGPVIEGLFSPDNGVDEGIKHAEGQVGKAFGGVENAAGDAWNQASDAASDAADAASNAGSDAADAVSNAADDAGDAVGDLF
jgi:hypothetical protein